MTRPRRDCGVLCLFFARKRSPCGRGVVRSETAPTKSERACDRLRWSSSYTGIMRAAEGMRSAGSLAAMVGIAAGMAAVVLTSLFWPALTAAALIWAHDGHLSAFAKGCLLFNGVWILGVLAVAVARRLPQRTSVDSQSKRPASSPKSGGRGTRRRRRNPKGRSSRVMRLFQWLRPPRRRRRKTQRRSRVRGRRTQS